MFNLLSIIIAGLLILLFLFDFLWIFVFRPFEVNALDLMVLLKATLLMLGLFCLTNFIKYLIAEDKSNTANILINISERTMLFGLCGGVMIIISTLMAVSNYLLMTTALPLQDEFFSMIDRSLGFDWISLMYLLDSEPYFSSILKYSYSTSIFQMMAVIIIYSLMNRPDRLIEFVALYTISGIVVGVVAMLLPAMGAHAFYNPDPALFRNFSDLGYVHIDTLQKLRDGTFKVLNFDNMVGMVSFPSFHTVLAIIVTYTFRGNIILFIPVFMLNTLVVFSTLSEGGHYFVDIIGGTLIAFCCITLVRKINAVHHKTALAGLSEAHT